MQFSPCGCYLHVASLEGRWTAQTESEFDSLSLALVVRTYRLCRHQPTRTPPSLLHSESGVRLQLGTISKLPVPRVPFTLSWTPEYLYMTQSHLTLRVFRIALFPPKKPDPSFRAVMRPTETILLPESAERRKVHYIPPERNSQRARVIISHIVRRGVSYALLERTPAPVGCDLDEQADLGGWTDSDYPVDVPRRRGGGRLEQPLEKFDPEEDCDRT